MSDYSDISRLLKKVKKSKYTGDRREISKKILNASPRFGNLPGKNGAQYSVQLFTPDKHALSLGNDYF